MDKKSTPEDKQHHMLTLNLSKGVVFGYDYTRKRSVVALKHDTVKEVGLYAQLQYMLGFRTHFLREKIQTARYPIDLRAGIDALYIYCDLVENSIVGNIRAPLLRTVAVKGNFGEITEKIYISPHYVPLLKKEFDTVHITIKDDQNRLIPFAFGKTLVKLHFRKCKLYV